MTFPAATSTRSLRSFALALCGLAAIGAAQAQPIYQVTELPVLAGMSSCVATRMNELGDVVGHCVPAVENFNQVAVVWRGGTVSALGRLTGGLYSMATAINNLGRITGDGDTGNYRPQSWVTTPSGALLNIFPNNGGNTHAVYIADSGWIGGYYTKSLSGNTSSWKGAVWAPDPKDARKYRTIDLPVLPGGVDPKSTTSLPFAFNASGQAAGYAMNDQIGQHAAFWNNDAARSVVDLGVVPGDWSSIAYGINDLGQVVGSSHPPFGSRPVVWNNDAAHTPYVLPTLPGDNYGRGTAINSVGQAIGVSYYGTPGSWDATPERTVLWRDGAVFELQSVLDPATSAGLAISAASAINNRGQITASGVRAGQARALLLTPIQ